MHTVIIIAIIVVGLCAIGGLIYFAIKFFKMSKEERINKIKKFVQVAIIEVEGQLGSGCGEKKLQAVENYFYQKAPISYKVILRLLGKETLKDIIELGLEEIKNNFAK